MNKAGKTSPKVNKGGEIKQNINVSRAGNNFSALAVRAYQHVWMGERVRISNKGGNEI